MKKLWVASLATVMLVGSWGGASWAATSNSSSHGLLEKGKGKITIKGCNAKGTVRFMFWGDKGDLYAQRQSIKAAKKACPGLKVVEDWHQSGYDTALLTAIGSGNAPDLFQLDGGKRIPEFVTKGALTNLDSYVKRDKVNMKKTFWAGCLGELSYHKHLYGLMRSCGNQKILYFNKDMFDAKHVAYPTNNWTTSQFAKAAQELGGNYTTASDSTSRLRVGYGFNTDDFAIETMMYQWGGDWLSANLHQCTLTSKPVRDAFQFYHDLRWKLHGAATPSQEPTTGDWFGGFQKGTVGMTFAGAWAKNYLFHENPGATESPPPFKWGAVLEPKGPKSRQGVMASTAEVISASSKNKNAAWWLARFVTEGQGSILQGAAGIDTPGAIKLWDAAPVKKEYGFLLGVARAAQKYGRSPRLVPQYDSFNDTVRGALDNYWKSENGDVNAATTKACQDVASKGLLP